MTSVDFATANTQHVKTVAEKLGHVRLSKNSGRLIGDRR